MSFKEDKKYFLDILSSIGLPVTYPEYWWVRYPKRAVQEISVMKENTNADFVHRGNKLIWEEKIMNNFDSYFLISIQTGADFPFTMPKAFVIHPKIECDPTIHIYREGNLCLMHPDTYHSKMLILETRNLSAAWCFSYEAYLHTGKWPAAQHKH